ncbi:MAG: DMT family transporter [Calditrichales bacterium]|nr:MAG: DMT family transporter [Calditrichales bacterium]
MIKPDRTLIKTIIFTLLALTAFAANSLLGRMALGGNTIDAASFTSIRLLSGTLMLLLILKTKRPNNNNPGKGSWGAALMLFTYAVTFSFAYITLETGTGALILFAAVQITMILWSLKSGNRLHLTEWLGLFIAFSGFVYLVSPGVTSPSLTGFLLMTMAGIAWGIYTLKGGNSKNPLIDTAFNFSRSILFVAVLLIMSFQYANISYKGIVLAVLSGSITSGIGYAIWYRALRGLSVTVAAVVQLSVPVFATLGGVIFLSEQLGFRLLISSTLIIGGILAVILGRYKFVTLGLNNKR